jgi:hypothetical protein
MPHQRILLELIGYIAKPVNFKMIVEREQLRNVILKRSELPTTNIA